jgi:hypothetical protein
MSVLSELSLSLHPQDFHNVVFMLSCLERFKDSKRIFYAFFIQAELQGESAYLEEYVDAVLIPPTSTYYVVVRF